LTAGGSCDKLTLALATRRSCTWQKGRIIFGYSFWWFFWLCRFYPRSFSIL